MTAADATYFAGLDAALKKAGIAWPVMVIDRDRLDANLAALAGIMPAAKHLRIVAKSLPSAELLRHVTERLKTDRLMTFSVAMLKQLNAALPGMHHLFGKPVPVVAVAALLKDKATHQLALDTIWLADTPARIRQFEDMAELAGVRLKIALEIDVGLRRGGFDPDKTLGDVLYALYCSPSLTFSGMLGYEPHLPALPAALGIKAKAEQDFDRRYRHAQALAAGVFGEEAVSAAVMNSGGSKTLAARISDDFVNDLSIGSLLLKPTDFDAVERPPMQPAAFIATPLLKKGAFRVPGFGSTRMMQRLFEKGARQAIYIHGGHWLAEPVHPAGLSYSGLLGRSSNQEVLVSRRPIAANVDDFVFLRPHQSEAVLLQFGPLVVVSKGAVAGSWEVFPPTA